MSTSLYEDKVRITIADLPPRASRPSNEELNKVFGGFFSFPGTGLTIQPTGVTIQPTGLTIQPIGVTVQQTGIK